MTWSLFVVHTLACAAPPDDDPLDAIGATQDAILGGTVDTENDATVALLIRTPAGNEAVCSGTIVKVDGARGYVLTAAHCVTGSVTQVMVATDWHDCWTSPLGASCKATYPVTRWTAHPAYAGTPANDFAVVEIAGTSAATPFVPVIDELDPLGPGSLVELSGYGRLHAGPLLPEPLNTVRYHVTAEVGSVSELRIRFDTSTGIGSCFGDSGGPAYAIVEGKKRVVGVTSSGDEECASLSIYGRVSGVYDGFIAAAIGEPVLSACDACTRDATIENGVCGPDATCARCDACADECDTTGCPSPDEGSGGAGTAPSGNEGKGAGKHPSPADQGETTSDAPAADDAATTIWDCTIARPGDRVPSGVLAAFFALAGVALARRRAPSRA